MSIVKFKKPIEDMNRNELFEWKKKRVQELAKTGMKVADIAKSLDMGEEDMYSFLSRNFGGVRRLREELGVSNEPSVSYGTAAQAASTQAIPKRKEMPDLSIKDNVKVTLNDESQPKKETTTIMESFKDALRKEKENILNEFKLELEDGKTELVEEMKKGLEGTKIELLETFKTEFLQDLASMVSEI